MPNLFEHFRVPSKFGEAKVRQKSGTCKDYRFILSLNTKDTHKAGLPQFSFAFQIVNE